MALIFTKSQLFKIHFRHINIVVNYSKFFNDKEYKRCYKLLEVDESSDQEQIRLAYLRLVKKYHPDSGTEEANPEKFQEIDHAFKTLMHKKSKERWGVIEEANIVQEQDIKHTAPQHRQYLSYDGIGSGNPFQREKQYVKVLIDNGFTPEWILLQKEIRQEAKMLRKVLFRERQYFGPFPLSIEDNIEWSEKVYKYKNVVDKINKKIAKFNLVVPIVHKQMIQICLEKEAQKAMVTGSSYEDLGYEPTNEKNQKHQLEAASVREGVNLFGLLESFFKGK